MTEFVVRVVAKVDGVPTDGLQCVAYAASRFLHDGAGHLISPGVGSPPPDTDPPDGGPIASAEAFGGTGEVQIPVPDMANYMIGCWDVTNTSLIAWEGPRMAAPHTSTQGWTKAVDQTAHRSTFSGLIDVLSDGLTLPTATIKVDDLVPAQAVGPPTTGSLLINVGGAFGVGWTVVTYAGWTVAGTPAIYTFTGCTGGTGTLATGHNVAFGWKNGARRRLANVSLDCAVRNVDDFAVFWGVSTIGGTLMLVNQGGVQINAAGNFDLFSSISMPVDPLGWYGILNTYNGGAGCLVQLNPGLTGGWIEVDF